MIFLMMETPVGNALREVNTCNQWSTLTGVLGKLNRKLPAHQQLDARTLAALLVSEPAEVLATSGIWITQFGDNYMPIILVNRSYARKVALGGSMVMRKIITLASSARRIIMQADMLSKLAAIARIASAGHLRQRVICIAGGGASTSAVVD